MIKPGQKLKLLPDRPFATPFGRVRLPEIELPPLKLPKLDSSRRENIRQAIGADASDIIGLIPFVGDSLSRNVETLHQQAIRENISEHEFSLFMKRKKAAPFDTFALIRAYVEEDTGI